MLEPQLGPIISHSVLIGRMGRPGLGGGPDQDRGHDERTGRAELDPTHDGS